MAEETCPYCGQEIIWQRCEIPGCKKEAEFDAWFWKKDHFGNPLGINVRLLVCEEHVKLSIAMEKT